MSFLAKLKQWFAAKPKSAMKRVDIDKRFDLINRTGQGSMSKVWQARDMELGRTVCLKILDKEKTAKFEARFPGANKPPEGEICLEPAPPEHRAARSNTASATRASRSSSWS